MIRALEIISEASRRLPDAIRDRYPEIDWTAVAAAANIYRHEYEGVDERLIWLTIQHDLHPLEQAVRTEMEGLS
ncbi:MAG TPA: HepT-like ribonuclease domain-containing protein [Acidobacteriaceae bacterium]|nr:HepT-like ribonuclease domain-containing protein [Acidobacteriaceae bacterium]